MVNPIKILFLTLALFSFVNVRSQTAIIRGRVIDKADRSSIIGATIIEYDLDERVVNGAISDVNGNFILEMKDPANSVKVSFIGYTPVNIPIDLSQPISVEMEPAVLGLY